MKNKRYFDTFEKYEECFNKIWDKFPLGDKPEWRHWWFYRYLQISPSYIAWTEGMKEKRIIICCEEEVVANPPDK